MLRAGHSGNTAIVSIIEIERGSGPYFTCVESPRWEFHNVDRRVAEFSALIKRQLRLIRQLEKEGEDSTSARIVLASLHQSHFLATQNCNRKICVALQPAELTGGGTQMTIQHDCLDLIDKMDIDGTEQEGDNMSVVPECSDKQEIRAAPGRFEFRPLTEKEKKEFVNSLDAKGKQILAELEGRAGPSHKSAA